MGETTTIKADDDGVFHTVVPAGVISQLDMYGGMEIEWQITVKEGALTLVVTPTQ